MSERDYLIAKAWRDLSEEHKSSIKRGTLYGAVGGTIVPVAGTFTGAGAGAFYGHHRAVTNRPLGEKARARKRAKAKEKR
jgi:hypothetical protein